MVKINLLRPVATKAVVSGLLGALGLFSFYYLIAQLQLYQPWMSLLIVGFGLTFMTWMLFGKQKPKVILNYLFSNFNLSLNTHSVELDYDYTQIAKLTDDF